MSERPAVDPLPLRALQATLDPATAVAPLDDLTVVRTPTRPTFREGNALHLRTTPGPDDVERLLAVWEERFGAAGPTSVRIRWVEPDSGRDLDEVRAAADPHGLAVDVTWHMELHDLLHVATPPRVEIIPATDPRQWHGATVLFRHTDWGEDEAFRRRTMAGREQLTAEGRAVTYVAVRWGIPVGTATLCWDPLAEVGPDHAGLAVVVDIVVHPAHRGAGIGSALVHTTVARHLAAHPRARVVLQTDAAAPLSRRLGFETTATLGTLHPAAT